MKKIDHIGIAVHSLEETLPIYTDIFQMKLEGIETVESQGVKVAFLHAGNTMIELLEAVTEESAIAKFIEKRGQGIHHIAYQVEGISERIAELKEKGIRMIDETPRPGAHGTNVAFLHPKSAAGVLYELCEHPEKGGQKE